MDKISLASQYGTPLYVYDFDHFSSQYKKFKDAFKAQKSLVAYAVKANSNLSVIKHFANLGSGADCVSIGEVRRALLAGVNPYKIIFSGVGKTALEIEEAINSELLFINAESEAECELIENIAAKMGKVARLSLRINPNIDAKTHPYISTGLHESKFGIDIQRAKKLYIKAKKSPHLDPIGVHFHIGSQLLDLAPIEEACVIIADFVRSLLALDIEIRFFDVGGGLGVPYDNEQTIDLNEYARVIRHATKGLDLTIITEPGRFLVANGGELLVKVLYEKHTDTNRFCIVDGAMNDFLRPSLYNAYHKVELIGAKDDSPKSKADIVGGVCESGDFLAKDVMLPVCEAGDILSVGSAGAYGFSMSSNYNTRPRPAEIAIIDKKTKLIRSRESIDEMLENEKKFL